MSSAENPTAPGVTTKLVACTTGVEIAPYAGSGGSPATARVHRLGRSATEPSSHGSVADHSRRGRAPSQGSARGGRTLRLSGTTAPPLTGAGPATTGTYTPC